MDSLKTAIRKSWDRDTSASPDAWGPSNPSLGQCAVTALIVQDHFGGKLKRIEVLDSPIASSHYFNELPDWKVVDLTGEQFPKGTKFGELADRSREVILSFEPTRIRYDRLKARVQEALGEQSGAHMTEHPFKEAARGENKDELVITKASTTDYERIKSLLVSELNTNPDTFTKGKFESAITQFGKYHLVARMDDKVVGFVSGFDDTGIFYGYMGRLVVDPEYRNQGVGARLMDACLEEFRKSGVSAVFAGVRRDNATSRELLGKAGFKDGDYLQVMNPL